MCAHSKVDENKNSIQMACDASDIYLPFCNISNHELIELHGFCLEIIKCIEKRTHWPVVQKYHKKKEDCRLIPVLYVEKKVKTKNDKKNVADWTSTKHGLPGMERVARGEGVHPPQ